MGHGENLKALKESLHMVLMAMFIFDINFTDHEICISIINTEIPCS